MELDDVRKRIKKKKMIAKPGHVYDIFDCCIREYTGPKSIKYVKRSGKRFKTCPKHGGLLLTKYKKCKKCGSEVVGNRIKIGDTCTVCVWWSSKNEEHPRGLYCKKFNYEKNGCSLCVNCWTCDQIDLWFPNTGPKRMEAPK